jgi:hypothetical protein
MIRIKMNIEYPDLTSSEEERLQELIRKQLQPFIATEGPEGSYTHG